MNIKRSTLKKMIAALSVVLVMLIGVAGTLAYLQMQTESVVNTFAPSNIDLDLYETKDGSQVKANTYKMVPGVAMEKDPTVTVSGDVDAYVFVEIVETGSVTVDGTTYTFDDFLTYAIATGWTVHTEESNAGNETVVVYREVKVADTTKTFSVLAGDEVTTNTSVTKQMMNAYTDGSIKLTFTAYAIQKAGFEGKIAEAWTAAQNQAQG